MRRIVIDFGSGYTKIYIPGCGVVLMEPTCIAVEGEGGNAAVKAYGKKAKDLSGRAAFGTHIVNPVCEGDIVQENLAYALLEYFLNKVELPPRKAAHAEVLFILPCGIEKTIAQKYRRLGERCGFAYSYFVRAPFASVLGHNVKLSESKPMFCIDMGHSVTNIAAVSQDGIIAGMSINIGGYNIDTHIMDELAENMDFKVGALTAETLKNSVGSLLIDDNKFKVVDGREVSSGIPTSVAVYSGQLYDIICAYVDKICEYAAQVLSKLSAEVSSGIIRGGIYLSGGMFKVDGVGDYISARLGIPVNMTEEPQLAPVIGAGRILSDDALLDKLCRDDF